MQTYSHKKSLWLWIGGNSECRSTGLLFTGFVNLCSKLLLVLLRASLCPIWLYLVPFHLNSNFSAPSTNASQTVLQTTLALQFWLADWHSTCPEPKPMWSWACFPCYISQSCGLKPVCLVITAELGIIYCILFKTCSWNSVTNFLAGLISDDLCSLFASSLNESENIYITTPWNETR